MDAGTGRQLASHGIVTRDDLAEQAIDDLTEIDGMDAAAGRRTDHGGAQALV